MKKAVEKMNHYELNGRPLKVKADPDGFITQREMNKVQGPPGMMGGMGRMDRMGMDRMGMDRMGMDRMGMDRMGMDRMGMDRMGMDRMGMDRMGMDRMGMDRMGMDRMEPMGPGPNSSMVNIPASLMNNPNIPNEIIHGLQAGKIGNSIFVANLDYKVNWKKLKEVFSMAGVVLRADILEDKDGKSRGMGTVTFEMPIEAVQAVSMLNGQMLFNRVMYVKLDEKSMPKDMAPPERPPALPRGLSGVGMGLGPGGQPIDATQLNRGGGGGGGSGMGNMGPGGMDGVGMGSMGNRMGGMDSFGGMNNMDRFGSSGMGRRNGNSSGMDRMSSGMDRLGGSMDRMSGMGMDRMDRLSDLDRLGSGFDRMGSGMDRLGPSMDRLGPSIDRMSSSMDRLGPSGFDRLGSSSLDRIGSSLDFGSPMGLDRMNNSGLERMGSSFDRMGSSGGLDRFSSGGLDRLGSGMDRMGSGSVGGQFDRSADMDRGFGGNSFSGAGSSASGAGGNPRGCQIFVRNLPFDFTWKMLKDAFNTCGMVQYADIKLENGKSKGCGVVRFDSPESAERACRTMNGYRLNGREIDVRMDRNA
ncbi:unnamed protein product [Knipowitschia caucasica]